MSRPVLRSRLFSSHLTTRILAAAGVAALGAHASCGSDLVAATGGSSSSSSSSSGSSAGGVRATTSSSTGNGGAGGAPSTGAGLGAFDAGVSPDALGPPPPGPACLAWDAGPCPTDPSVVVFLLDESGCTDGGNATKEASGVESGPTPMDGQCCYVVDFQWCIGGGRPYVAEDGEPRLPPVVRRRSASTSPEGDDASLAELSDDARRRLMEAWARDGQMEHASVASFSRFSLALLAVGAPADLVEEAHRAALDEVEHARLCFALASRYAGERLEAGAFPVGLVDAPASLAALAAATVVEGCVGETVAAIVAAEQLARASDPAVKSALARIAEDEARHAELAWRTVAWALEAGGAEVRAACADAFARALAEPPALPSFTMRETPKPPARPVHDAGLEAHGRLDELTLRAVADAATSDVVARCARAMLANPCRTT